MQRHFSPEEVREMSPELKQLVLNAQSETFHHVQEQSQKYFRMLLAAAAIIVGLAWSDILQSFTNLGGINQALSSTLVFQNGVAQNAPAVVNDSIFVGTMLGLIGAGLLFEGGMTTIWIMKIDGPLPTARRKDNDEAQLADGSTIDQWILVNDRRVTEALLYLNRCYTSIWGAIVLGFLSVFIIAASAIGILTLMGLFNLITLLLVPAVVLYYVKGPLMELYSGAGTNDLKTRLNAAIDRWMDSYEYVGPSAGLKIALFLAYSSIWDHSAAVVSFWLQFP